MKSIYLGSLDCYSILFHLTGIHRAENVGELTKLAINQEYLRSCSLAYVINWLLLKLKKKCSINLFFIKYLGKHQVSQFYKTVTARKGFKVNSPHFEDLK